MPLLFIKLNPRLSYKQNGSNVGTPGVFTSVTNFSNIHPITLHQSRVTPIIACHITMITSSMTADRRDDKLAKTNIN